MPLPEGVPEVLNVTCNGRSGRLLVRSQRVLQGDTEMSASKFEQVCGKGDAKKWKSSIWTEGEDGQQDMVCMLFLIEHDCQSWSSVMAWFQLHMRKVCTLLQQLVSIAFGLKCHFFLGGAVWNLILT